MTDRFRVVPAAYVILRRGDEVLLQLRQNTGYRDGYWASAAAGHVEQDESVYAAAAREAAEELGVGVSPGQLRPLCAMHRTHANGRPVDERVDFFFECRSWSGEPRRLEPHKSADLRWWRLDALPDNVVPHERTIFDTLLTGGPSPVVSYGF